MSHGRQLWVGLSCCLAGFLMLAVQVVLLLDARLLSAELTGGGIALVIVGAATLYYYFDDGRSGAPDPPDDQLPTAAEYETGLEQIDPDDMPT